MPSDLEQYHLLERARGHAECAERTTREALALAREGKLMRFIGPWLLATCALCDRDEAARRAALDEGAQLLAEGCVGHSYLNFYAQAIDASFELGDASAIERWCEGLESYMATERHPWGHSMWRASKPWRHGCVSRRVRRSDRNCSRSPTKPSAEGSVARCRGCSPCWARHGPRAVSAWGPCRSRGESSTG